MAQSANRSGRYRSRQLNREYGGAEYINGNTARKLQSVPAVRPSSAAQGQVSMQARRNRERALQMNLGYVVFLTVAAVITLFMCVNFLQLQAKGTKLQKEVTVLEARLDAKVLENNADYQRIMTGVDLEYVKGVAMNQLGMNYAKKSQIVTYEIEEQDYVRQYSEIPAE